MSPEKPTERRLVPQLELDKPIYTLGVASEMLDAHPRTLMVYEQLEMVKPQRTATNRRRYSPRDVMKLQAIQASTWPGLATSSRCSRSSTSTTSIPRPASGTST